ARDSPCDEVGQREQHRKGKKHPQRRPRQGGPIVGARLCQRRKPRQNRRSSLSTSADSSALNASSSMGFTYTFAAPAAFACRTTAAVAAAVTTTTRALRS